MKNTRFLFFVIIIAMSSNLAAQTGSLDPTFANSGKYVYDLSMTDLYYDVQVQPDGKIVAAGTSMNYDYALSIQVSRLLPEGTPDPDFGTDGHFNYSLNVENQAYKCRIRDNGKILIAGYTTDYNVFAILLLQLNADGTLDPDFGDNGISVLDLGPGEDIAFAMELLEDGRFLVAGYSQNSDYRNAPVVLRFSETGVFDTSFGIDGVATVPVIETDNDFSAVSIQSDGKIVAAGHISSGMSWFSLLIARFDQDGNLDPSYGTFGIVNMNLNSVDDEFYDMALTENDETILTGFTVTQDNYFYHLLVMKFDIYGQPVTDFGNEGMVIFGEVPYTFGDALIIQPDEKILIAGCTGDLTWPGLNNDWAIWRFNPDGSLDETFGAFGLTTTDFYGYADEALGIALQADKIIVAGKLRNETEFLDFAVARYINDVAVSVPEIVNQHNLSVSPNPVRRNGNINIAYELKQPETISIELISITGSSISVMPVGTQAEGQHSFQFTIPSELASGIYSIKIMGTQSTYMTSKVIMTD